MNMMRYGGAKMGSSMDSGISMCRSCLRVGHARSCTKEMTGGNASQEIVEC